MGFLILSNEIYGIIGPISRAIQMKYMGLSGRFQGQLAADCEFFREDERADI